jgi:maltose O-acetyltransferase
MVQIFSRLRYFFQNLPVLLGARHFLRKAELHGSRIRVFGKPAFHIDGKLIVHDRVRIISTITPVEIGVGANGILEICEGAYINYGTSISALSRVTIGRNCLIGTYVNITDNNFHHVEPERRLETPPSAPVVIAENVWLGTRVIVLPGVTIGANSVIGAGSVVTRSIPANVVAAGVPAKVIKEI